MNNIVEILISNNCFDQTGPLSDTIKEKIAVADSAMYATSACTYKGEVFCLRKAPRARKLMIIKPGDDDPGKEFAGSVMKITAGGRDVFIKECAASAQNAGALRKTLPFTAPSILGLEASIGMGDRLGIATPGHIRAAAGYDIRPIFPQQSIREMERTSRTPQQVMDDACWSVFQEGYREPFGADADHLKTEDDVRRTAGAGFTFYTIDPSAQLNHDADDMSGSRLVQAFDALFNDDAEKAAMVKRYTENDISLTDPDTGFTATFIFDEIKLARIAVKYYPAVKHTIKLHALLVELLGSAGNFDFEMSVDETSQPTTPEEHLFVAAELKANAISAQSLAPRYIGEFQKGIDYIGDIDMLRDSLLLHALIARCMGPYKLSIHSGSDKFSVFPVIGELTRGLFHEKTAGTSYIEAIRIVARHAPALYREIHKFALSRFEHDRATYHVTTDLAKIPVVGTLSDNELEPLMDENNARQLIHITYGSVLTHKDDAGNFVFYDRIMDVLDEFEEEHYAALEKHFRRHIVSFGVKRIAGP